MKRLTLLVVPSRGNIDNDHWGRIYEWLDEHNGQAVEISLTAISDSPTAKQYAYLFGTVYVTIAKLEEEHSGRLLPLADIDYVMRCRFLRKDVPDLETGDIFPDIASKSHDLDVPDMATYIDYCLHWIAQHYHYEVEPFTE